MENENPRLYKQRAEMDLDSMDLTEDEWVENWDNMMLDAPLTITADAASAVVRLFEKFEIPRDGSVVKSLRSQLHELGMEA